MPPRARTESRRRRIDDQPRPRVPTHPPTHSPGAPRCRGRPRRAGARRRRRRIRDPGDRRRRWSWRRRKGSGGGGGGGGRGRSTSRGLCMCCRERTEGQSNCNEARRALFVWIALGRSPSAGLRPHMACIPPPPPLPPAPPVEARSCAGPRSATTPLTTCVCIRVGWIKWIRCPYL